MNGYPPKASASIVASPRAGIGGFDDQLARGFPKQPMVDMEAWRRAWLRQKAGNGQAHVVVFGDSISQGYYATDPYWTNSWPGRLATSFNSATGVTAGTGWWQAAEESLLVDARITATGTWTVGTGALAQVSYLTFTAGSTLTIGPITCSSIRIMYGRLNNTGTFSWELDGGSATNVNTVVAAGTQAGILEIDCGSLGSHTVVLRQVTGAFVLGSVEAIQNPLAGVKVSRAAYQGRRISNFMDTENVGLSRSMMRAHAPDLAVIMLGVNDQAFAEFNAGFKRNFVEAVRMLRSIGSSVIVASDPITGALRLEQYEPYRRAIRQVADEERCGFIDFTDEWGGAYKASYYTTDTTHPNDLGHASLADIVYRYAMNAVA